MYDGERSSILPFFAGLTLGAAVGAAVALLWAPRSGRLTRRHLRRTLEGGFDDANERWTELSDEMRTAFDAGRRRLRG